MTVLFTGGTGLLGRAMQEIAPEFLYPSHDMFDILNLESMHQYTLKRGIKTIIHAAAFTSPPKCERDPMHAVRTNIVGTANVVKVATWLDARLIYISTDYVFDGRCTMYNEDDPINPQGVYALTKAGGEFSVRPYRRGLVVRTSFGPDVFPYPGAYVDQFTSRLPVGAFARRLFAITQEPKLSSEHGIGVIHVGGKRQTVYDYALSLGATNLKELSRLDRKPPPPEDTSLDTRLFNSIFHPE